LARTPVPIRSVTAFFACAILLRVLFVAASWVFPAFQPFQNAARILIGIVTTLALVWLNRRFLLKERLADNSLGLSLRQSSWFLSGGLLAIVFVGLIAGSEWPLNPFRWESGVLPGRDVAWHFAEYFGSNFTEELIFRGYLLLILQRSLGLARALLIASLLFGVFHLPGLSGISALKMICTTTLFSCVLGLVFIRTGSLWTAVGMHVVGNTVLHRVLGMSGEESVFRIEFMKPPAAYDAGLIAYVVVSLVTITALFWSGAAVDGGSEASQTS
jgi:membrane protease YdiL (CAAX protease family)